MMMNSLTHEFHTTLKFPHFSKDLDQLLSAISKFVIQVATPASLNSNL